MSVIEIMNRVAKGEISADEAATLIGGAKSQNKLSLKIGEKGGLSLYGMGRFPVTLYREQWERLLGHEDEIKKFIAANAGKLTSKSAA
jgi:hypothetical protein